MTSSIKLIINFENPLGHIKVFGDQLGEAVDELLLVVNIDAADRGGNVGQLKDLFGS